MVILTVVAVAGSTAVLNSLNQKKIAALSGKLAASEIRTTRQYYLGS